MEPTFFEKQADLREWFEKNHNKVEALWVGYYKKGTGIPSIDWSQSVDEAICFGWIDGIRKKIDDQTYKIRFTPRKPRSHWSAVNIEKVQQLTKLGLMKPEGLAAYKKRDEKRSGQASYEQAHVALDKDYEKEIQKNKKAWEYFENMAPYYRKATIHWVMSAKKEETRLKRLDVLIKSSEEGQKIPPMRYGDKKA
ncbi:YdeI/OmpD-associated family protein [Fulvivirgaceae bacterium BMA10]|uniref:YdeI/OmpD-associated family protein n=1 Tax=Splendidivirga corallicola TaxID=3051826 RepID=A0ABT8KJ97_9BACT|nr:YdeI/OmpD-associated family protein [Fulvivirgaceae bacterium BMA10]